MDLTVWLRDLGLEQYEQTFRENAVDAEVLSELTAEDLKDIGVTAVGHRRKLLQAIAELRGAKRSDAEASPLSLTKPEGERRQVTVLFADLSGFSTLSNELDAEEVHAVLGQFFESTDRLVTAWGGLVDKHIGDCVMAVFGAPVAHGNDAERAVRAALGIRNAAAELAAEPGRGMHVHIGVASGQVVAGGTGSSSHREYTVTGDTVNLASRLTEAAAAGEILISEPVRRALADRLECSERGPLAVKGFSDPVLAWQLHGLRAEDGDRHPFVGRSRTMQQLRAALSTCLESGRGQVICLRGEAGIGKTRLVAELQALARAAGFACHTGVVLDFGSGTGRDAVRVIVRGLLGLDAGDEVDVARAAAKSAVADGLLEGGDAVFLNELLDLPQPQELRTLYDAMDNATRNSGKRRAVARLVERASRACPRLLVIEDVHWADSLVLAHLAQLTTTVADCPALLVMTTRTEGDPCDRAWRARTAGTPLVTIDLGPLRPEEARALARTAFVANEGVAERCVERAAGNPLFLQQLLLHAEESEATAVPGSVQSLVHSRLDRLEPTDKAALQAASVLGQQFRLDVLAHTLGPSQLRPEHLLGTFLVRPEGEDFQFMHALIRDAIYNTLLKRRRRELHRRAADWFAERDLMLHAEHLERAEDPSAPGAYLQAARALSRDYRFEQAQVLAQRGIDLASDSETKYELLCLKGEACRELGTIDESIAAFERALALVSEDEARETRAWIDVAAGMRLTERYENALEALDKAQSRARDCNLTESLADIHYQRAGLHFRLGDIDECLTQSELALKFAHLAASPEREARALSVLGDAYYMRGRMITAHGHYRHCLEKAQRFGFGRIEVANLHMRGLTRYFQKDLRGALVDSRAAVQAAVATGHHRAEMIARGILGGLLLDMGDPGPAEENFAAAITLAQRLGARSYEPFSFVNLGKIQCLKGDRSEGLRLVEQAVAISREVGFKTSGPRALGALALLTDDAGTRRRALREGEEVLRKGCISHHYFSFYRDAMEACLHTGDWDQGERYAAALEDYTWSEPLPLVNLLIARARAIAAWSRGARDCTRAGKLRRLREEAEQIGLKAALPAFDAALKAV